MYIKLPQHNVTMHLAPITADVIGAVLYWVLYCDGFVCPCQLCLVCLCYCTPYHIVGKLFASSHTKSCQSYEPTHVAVSKLEMSYRVRLNSSIQFSLTLTNTGTMRCSSNCKSVASQWNRSPQHCTVFGGWPQILKRACPFSWCS